MVQSESLIPTYKHQNVVKISIIFFKNVLNCKHALTCVRGEWWSKLVFPCLKSVPKARSHAHYLYHKMRF